MGLLKRNHRSQKKDLRCQCFKTGWKSEEAEPATFAFLPASNESVAKGFGDGLGFGVDLQFFVDVAHVEGNDGDADTNLNRRGLIVVSFDEELQKARLVRRAIATRTNDTYIYDSRFTIYHSPKDDTRTLPANRRTLSRSAGG